MIPWCQEKNDDELRGMVDTCIRRAILLDRVFENPYQEGQIIAFCEFNSKEVWFVLGDDFINGDPNKVVVTLRVHKDSQFKEEYDEVYENPNQTGQHPEV